MEKKMFKDLIKKHGLSQSSIARMLNVTPQAVFKWCHGLGEPRLQTVIRMSEVFNISINDIVLSFKHNEVVNGNTE